MIFFLSHTVDRLMKYDKTRPWSKTATTENLI